MNENLEKKLRVKVRKIVESILDEETPMIPADDFKPKTAIPKKTTVGKRLTVSITDKNNVLIESGNTSIMTSKDDAIKLANYLFRVLGKV